MQLVVIVRDVKKCFVFYSQNTTVFLESIKSDESRIAVSSLAGDIQTLSLPNLLPISCWGLSDQPLADEVTPDLQSRRSLNTHFPVDIHMLPTAITWWNESHLVISRISGSVSVHAVDSDFVQVTEPEWFEEQFPNIPTL